MIVATTLAFLAAAVIKWTHIKEADAGYDHLAAQVEPWLVVLVSLVAVTARPWASAAYAFLAAWGALTLTGGFSDSAVWAVQLMLSCVAGVLLVAAGVLGATTTSMVAPGRPAPVALRVLAIAGAGLLLFHDLSLVDANWVSTAARLIFFMSAAECLAVVLVLIGVMRRTGARWLGGALIGVGMSRLISLLDHGHVTGLPWWLWIASGSLLTIAGVGVLAFSRAASTPEPVCAVRSSADETTLALCAAMHLDRAIARKVAEEVVDRVSRSVPPSWGVDVGLVVRHCQWAVRRQSIRDAALLGTLAAAMNVALYSLVSEDPTPGWLLAFVAGAPLVIVVGERLLATTVVRRHLLSGANCTVTRLGAADESIAQALEEAATGNVVRFDGFLPFVGSGAEVGGWSFALKTPEPSPPLVPNEIYIEICRDLEKLGIDGLNVDQKVYVDTDELQPGSPFLTDDQVPRTAIDHAELEMMVERPQLHHRVYRCVRVSGWGGEYVISLFLNIERRTNSLFVAARYFLLAPVDWRYFAILRGDHTVAGALAAGVRATLPLFFWSVPATAAWVGRLIRWPDGVRAHATGSAPARPVERRQGVREIAQGTQFRRYFQQLDWEMTTKLLERELLAGLTRALRTRGVDTKELETREATILNYGVIVSGGELNAENLAVGKGAQSILTRVVAAAQAARGRQEK